MPSAPTSEPRQFIQGAPVLHVPDPLASAAYYRDRLGFTWDFADEAYCVVWRDNSAVHFVRATGDRPPSGIHLLQWVKDVDVYHAEVVERGATIIREPADQPYGLREFSIRDDDGIEIIVAQDID